MVLAPFQPYNFHFYINMSSIFFVLWGLMGKPESILVVLLLSVTFLHRVAGIIEPVNKRCDIYRGTWVHDSSYPLYNASNCHFILKEFNCQKNGRPDNAYLSYRWIPSSCRLPRFNGRKFVLDFKGKSIMFVGDSLSMNQWQSLNCLLHTAVPKARYSIKRTGGLSTFKIHAYNVMVLFSRNAFLVDVVEERNGRVLKLDYISDGDLWRKADVLIFNSWHWWLHTGRKQPWDMIQEGQILYKDMDRFIAYEKALITWANWIQHNIDFTKTKVFFQGVSPDHGNSTYWGNLTGKNCRGETKPQFNQNFRRTHPAETIAERVLSTISGPVHLLNVTALSQQRKDGHPSGYGYGGHHASDCSHWCLPGVPDTWNELLQAALIRM